MKKITFVALSRAEGLVEDCFAIVFHTTNKAPKITNTDFKDARFVKTDNIRDAVLRQMYVWGLTAPSDGGYDKTDFMVNWTGKDNSYTGRYDMKFGGTDSGKSFWDSLKSRIEFYALLRKPEWMTDEMWIDYKKNHKASAKDANRMLKDCEIPVL